MGLTAVHAQKPFIDSLAIRKQQEGLEKHA
jgi:hypothetical protein